MRISLPPIKRFTFLQQQLCSESSAITLPKEYTCSITNNLVLSPAIDGNGNVFCKEALLNLALQHAAEMSEPDGKITAENGVTITRERLLELLSYPVNKELQLQCMQFVEQTETLIDQTNSRKPRRKIN